MALALGVSVASATDPVFQYGTSGLDSNNSIQNPANEISVGDVTWKNVDGLLQATITANQTVIDTIDFVLQQNTNDGSSSVSGSTLTITGGGRIETDRQPVIQLTSSTGLLLGNNGSGKIKVDFDSAKYATGDDTKSRMVVIDLSGVQNGIALKGNINIETGSANEFYNGVGHENYFVAKFGGEGMQGNITVTPTGDKDGLRESFIFSGNASLKGDFTLEYTDRWESNVTNTDITFENGDITGKFTSLTSGSTSITYGQENKTIASSLDMVRGTLTYSFADSVTSNKVFTLDTSDSSTQVDTDGDGTADAIRSRIDISGGKVVFDGVSQLVFKNGSSDNVGVGTLTIAPKSILAGGSKQTFQNGSLVINLDSSAQASASNPIIKGSISATNGNIAISLKDPSSKTGINPFTDNTAQLSSLDTYYTTGSVSITDGGISAFWDDSKGFYGKLSTPITASGSLIGKSDVWFSQAQTISSIQATSGGISHLVFDSLATITGANSIGIKSTQNNATQILFKGGANITGNITQETSGYNKIAFEAQSSIEGDIIANGNISGNGSLGGIGNALVFGDGGSITGTINVTTDGRGWGGYNMNNITFSGKGDATITGTISSDDGGTGRGNVITFNGSGDNKIDGDLSATWTLHFTNGRNKIVFSENGASSVITGDVKTDWKGINIIEFNRANGVIKGQVIAKGSEMGGGDVPLGANKITFANGGSIEGGVSSTFSTTGSSGNTLNMITFSGVNNATISGGVQSDDANPDSKGNIIDFNGTGTNQIRDGIVANTNNYGASGRNVITFANGSQSSISGDIKTTLGGVNIIKFNGANGRIVGNISSNGNASSGSKGGNQIAFANGGSIEGDIKVIINPTQPSLAGYTTNTITFNGTNNATITGDITSNDGNADKGNIITFNGSGTNKIDGDISTTSTNYLASGRNIIKFTNAEGTSIVEGDISVTSGLDTFGLNQIDFGGKSNTLAGDLLSQGGATNRITFTGSDNKILKGTNGTITANDSGSGGNSITATNGTLTIGSNTDKISVIAEGGGANASNTITAKIINANLNQVSSGSAGQAQYSNTITADSGTINITTLSATTFNNANLPNNIVTNTITLKQGSLVLGSVTSNGGYGRDGKNEFTLGTSGNITASVTATTTTLGDGGKTIFDISGSGSTLTFGGNIATSSDGVMNITLNSDNIAVTLQGEQNTITTLTAIATATNGNTLTLDTTSNDVTTTIDTVANGNNLKVILNKDGSNNSTSLSFTKATTLKSVTLQGTANNALTFNAGANSISEKISVGDSQDLTLNFSGTTTSLALTGGLEGGAISVGTTDGTLSGGVISGASLTFADTTKLTLQNTSAVFTAVDASAGGAILGIGGGSNAVNATINALKGGDTLSIEMNGASDKSATLAILDSDTSDKTITLKNVSLASGSINNTLDLSSLASATITDNINVGQNQALKLKTSNTTLTLEGGLSTATQGTSEIEMTGSSATLILQGDTEISTLTAQSGGILEIDSSNTGLNVTTHTLNGVIGVKYKGSNAGDLIINGGTHTLSSITFDGTNATGTLTLNNTTTTIASAVTATTDNTLAFTLRSSELKLSGDNTLTSIDAQNSRINLSELNFKNRASERNKLTIGNYASGSNANFVVYADSKNADKVVFNATNGTNADTSATISVIGGTDLFNVAYTEGGSNNVMIVDANPTNGTKADIAIQGGASYIGGVYTVAEVIEGKAGTGDEGKYFIGKIEDRGLGNPYKEIANTALTVNYDLFLANFNSLNKRMGELRDNPYAQGVWARVFGGAMSNDFGAGSKTEYVTAQAGYDYSLTLGDARNYMGIAVAYGKSWTKSNNVSTGNIVNGQGIFSLDNVDSNMVEVGIYNSYVMDSGWYNDTIFKFDYIMSEFSLSNDPTKTSTNNFAMVLSDEFGYRYKFAESEKGNWYIDPQVELAFGYFNQSDFNRVLYDANSFGTDIKATQDTILTLRTRAGLSLGKKFNTTKGFASVYVGAFYEYDYIEGGSTNAGRVGGTITSLDSIESNGRAIVNIGSNIELSDGVRMYIDVEKSFGDKQRTDMQFNFGARYSFGEKNPTLSTQETQKPSVAPLKIEEKK